MMSKKNTFSRVISKCIYCGENDNLEKEHFLPYGLGGNLVLEKASCRNCATITGELEQRLLRGHWWPYRLFLGLKSRRPKTMPPHLPVKIIKPSGEKVDALLPMRQQSAAVVVELDPPKILDGIRSDEIPAAPRVFLKLLAKPPDKVILNQKTRYLEIGENIDIPVNFDIGDFCRFLAKVAYGYAVFERGLESCSEYYLPELILGKVEGALTYIGGCSSKIIGPRLPGTGVHAFLDHVEGDFLSVYIQLFRDKGDPPPIYNIVVGKLRN